MTPTGNPHTDAWKLRTLRKRESGHRLGQFAVDQAFERMLLEANEAWAPLEARLVAEAPPPRVPLLVICYPPRSGSTMLGQMLARTRAFNYVTNHMARYWEAPYLAGLIEKKIGLRQVPFPSEIRSAFGVTFGPTEPHEFGFFWNKWLVFEEGTHRIAEALMPDKRVEAFRRELWAMMSLYDQPFFLKSDLVGLNAAYFGRMFNDIVYVVLKRDPLFVAQSIYQARMQLYANPAVYWSTRPSNRPDRPEHSPAEQIALQIKGIYQDIYRDLRTSGARFIEVQYEALCQNPVEELSRILFHVGLDESGLKDVEWRTNPGNRLYLPRNIIQELVRALNTYL